MGRYLGPICRLCRREGVKLCDKHKCASIRRPYPPGMHGKDSTGKKSDYSKQLREKQKTRRIFGVSEKQIQKYYRIALSRPENSGEELIRQLENRFDNILYRCGFATTRRQARQFVAHGLFLVNGKRSKVPSLQLEPGDKFELRKQNREMPAFEQLGKQKTTPPKWLNIDPPTFSGQIISKAVKEDLESSIDPQMIIEFYSR